MSQQAGDESAALPLANGGAQGVIGGEPWMSKGLISHGGDSVPRLQPL